MKNNPYQFENYGLGCACQDATQQGLGGFWSSVGAWAWRKVKNNVSALGVIGSAISNAMDVIDGDCNNKFSTWLNENGGCGRTTDVRDYTLTDQELLIIENWASTFFSPFYDKLIKDCNEIFTGSKNIDEQLKIINSAITKMYLFLEYLKTNPNGFSANMNKEQLIGAEEFFYYTDKIIQDIILESDVLLEIATAKVSSPGLDFSPFTIPSISANADLWRVANGGIVPTSTTLQPTSTQLQALQNVDPTVTENKPTSMAGTLLVITLLGIGIYAISSNNEKK